MSSKGYKKSLPCRQCDFQEVLPMNSLYGTCVDGENQLCYPTGTTMSGNISVGRHWQTIQSPDGCFLCPSQQSGLMDNHCHLLPCQKMRYSSSLDEDLSTWLVKCRSLATPSLGKRGTTTARKKIHFCRPV